MEPTRNKLFFYNCTVTGIKATTEEPERNYTHTVEDILYDMINCKANYALEIEPEKLLEILEDDDALRNQCSWFYNYRNIYVTTAIYDLKRLCRIKIKNRNS